MCKNKSLLIFLFPLLISFSLRAYSQDNSLSFFQSQCEGAGSYRTEDLQIYIDLASAAIDSNSVYQKKLFEGEKDLSEDNSLTAEGVVKWSTVSYCFCKELYTRDISQEEMQDYNFNCSKAFFRAKDYETVIPLASKFILLLNNKETNPIVGELSYFYYLRGFSKKGLKDYKGSIDDFNQAIKYSNIQAQGRDFVSDLYFLRGMSYQGIGDFDSFLQDLKESVRINDKNGESFHMLGLGYLYAEKGIIGCKMLEKAAGLGVEEAQQDLEAICK